MKFYISLDKSEEIDSYVSNLLFLFYSIIYSKFAKDSPTSLNFISFDKSLFFANFFARFVYESNYYSIVIANVASYFFTF